MDEHVTRAFVETLLEQETPPVVATLVGVIGLVLSDEKTGHVGASGETVLQRDLAEEEHLQDVCELRRGDLVRHADVVQELGRDQGRRGDEARSLVFGLGLVGVWVDIDLVFGELGVQDVVVGCVAEAVKGFVRVFDSQFDDGFVGNAGGMDDGVEVGAVAEALMGRENEKLRDPKPCWQVGGPYLGHREAVRLDGRLLCRVSLVEPPAIRSRIADEGVWRSSRRRRSGFLVSAQMCQFSQATTSSR